MSKAESRTAAKDLPKEQLVQAYRDMLLQRRFEEQAGRSYQMGKIYGFCHLYIGQEAVSTSMALARQPKDLVVSAYRIHAQAIACGIPPHEVMHELFGRATGNVHGVGGSMHLYDTSKNFWGGWGLVGQQVSMGVGLAFAQKYKETGAVTVVFFGDGAQQQGGIHEAFNMASIWDVPVVFVVENNGYGMGTAIKRVSAFDELHQMAEPYGFAHEAFDGMDFLASYDAFSNAIETVRETSRPYFLEARTSRFRGHSMSDPGKYRTREQLDEEKSHDPLPAMSHFLIEAGHATEDELQAMDKEIKAEMKQLAKDAEAAPWPDPELIDRYVYVDPLS